MFHWTSIVSLFPFSTALTLKVRRPFSVQCTNCQQRLRWWTWWLWWWHAAITEQVVEICWSWCSLCIVCDEFQLENYIRWPTNWQCSVCSREVASSSLGHLNQRVQESFAPLGALPCFCIRRTVQNWVTVVKASCNDTALQASQVISMQPTKVTQRPDMFAGLHKKARPCPKTRRLSPQEWFGPIKQLVGWMREQEKRQRMSQNRFKPSQHGGATCWSNLTKYGV